MLFLFVVVDCYWFFVDVIMISYSCCDFGKSIRAIRAAPFSDPKKVKHWSDWPIQVPWSSILDFLGLARAKQRRLGLQKLQKLTSRSQFWLFGGSKMFRLGLLGLQRLTSEVNFWLFSRFYQSEQTEHFFFSGPHFLPSKRADLGPAIRLPKKSNIGLRKSIFAKTHFEQSEPLLGQKPTSTSSNPSRPVSVNQQIIGGGGWNCNSIITAFWLFSIRGLRMGGLDPSWLDFTFFGAPRRSVQRSQKLSKELFFGVPQMGV